MAIRINSTNPSNGILPPGTPASDVGGPAPHDETTTTTPPATTTGRPGWQARLKEKAKDAALTVLSQDVNVLSAYGSVGNRNLASLRFHGNISEKLALKNDDPLVTSNPDRIEAANNGKTWTKVGAVADAGATLLGFGYDRGVKVNSVIATDSKVTGKSLKNLAVDQAKVMTLEFHPNEITKHPPGTEFNISEHKTPSFGVVFGPDISVLGANAGAEVGAAVIWDKSKYAKNVTVEKDHRLSVKLDKGMELGASVGAGLALGYGKLDRDRRPNIGDFRNEPNHANILSLHIGAGASMKKGIAVKGNFDMETKEGQQAYAYLMEADPLKLGNDAEAARKAMKDFGVPVAFAQKTIGFHTDLSASAGKTNLINIGSSSRTTRGTLYEQRGNSTIIDETKLTEKEYTRNRSGLLPRWANGEERETSIRMGQVSVNNGPEMRAALLSLKVIDPKVTAQDSQEVANFASSLGYKTTAPTSTDGKGELAIKLGLTHDAVTQLDAMSKQEFKAAIGRGLELISGKPLPWNDETIGQQSTAYWNEQFKPALSIKARWQEAQHDLANLDTNAMSEMKIRQQYESSTGRDYYQDMNTHASMEVISKKFEKSKGKSLDDRGGFLKELSTLSSRDMQAVIVALRQNTDAGIVGLEYSGNGVTLKADAEMAAPASVKQIVDAAFDAK